MELAQWLEAFVALAENLGLVSSPYMVAHYQHFKKLAKAPAIPEFRR